MDICPSIDELLALLAGSDEGSLGLRAHVDDCPDCRRSVARLLGALRLGAEYRAFAEPADRVDLLTEVDMSPQAAQRIFEAADKARQQSLAPPAGCPSEDQLAKLLAEPEAVDPAVHEHVLQCSDCRKRVESLRGLLEHAADYDAFLCGGEEAPSDVHDRIFAAVSAKFQPPLPSCPSPICPNDDELIAVLAGSGQHASHRSHLDDCDVCREKAAKLLGAMRQGADCLAFVTGKIVSAVEPIPADVAKRIYEHLLEHVPPSGCPSWNELLAVLAGNADDAASRTHINQCATCQATAAKLLGAIRLWLEQRAFETGEIRKQAEEISERASRRIFDGISTLPAPRRMFQRAAAFVWRQTKKPQMQAIAASLLIAVTGFLLLGSGQRDAAARKRFFATMTEAREAYKTGDYEKVRALVDRAKSIRAENPRLDELRREDINSLIAALEPASKKVISDLNDGNVTAEDMDEFYAIGPSVVKIASAGWLALKQQVSEAQEDQRVIWDSTQERIVKKWGDGEKQSVSLVLREPRSMSDVKDGRRRVNRLVELGLLSTSEERDFRELESNAVLAVHDMNAEMKATIEKLARIRPGDIRSRPFGRDPTYLASRNLNILTTNLVSVLQEVTKRESAEKTASRPALRADRRDAADRLVKRHDSTSKDLNSTGASLTGGSVGTGG